MSAAALQFAPSARRNGVAGASHLLASAERLYQQLMAGLEVWGSAHGPWDRRGTAKLIAVVALALESRRLVRRPRAILIAAEVVGRARDMTYGARKKAASEARALVIYALGEGEDVLPAADDDAELLEQLDALFAPLSLQDALAARAVEHRQRGLRRTATADGLGRCGRCGRLHRTPGGEPPDPGVDGERPGARREALEVC